MQYFYNGIIILVTIAGMEVFSWAIHKYLFHGCLWFIHKTHHQPSKSFLEWNDVFSAIFALSACYFMWIGRISFTPIFWVGCGITLYGIIYFVFHDWWIHQRIKAFKISNKYLINIRRAHKIHHKSLEKSPSENFGLLYVAKKNQCKLKNHATNT